jgi:hypothetical protein
VYWGLLIRRRENETAQFGGPISCTFCLVLSDSIVARHNHPHVRLPRKHGDPINICGISAAWQILDVVCAVTSVLYESIKCRRKNR